MRMGKRGSNDAARDNAIGLTEAFAPINLDTWEDEYSKSRDEDEHFDEVEGDDWMPDDEGWDAFASSINGSGFDDGYGYDDGPDYREYDEASFVDADDAGEERVGSAELAVIGSAAVAGATRKRGSHAAPASAPKSRSGEPKRGRHAAPAEPRENEKLKEYLNRSKRMRNILTVVIVLLIALMCVGGYLVAQFMDEAQSSAAEQAQQEQQGQDTQALQGDEALDASTETVKKTSAPDLVSLVGLTSKQAVAELERGATVTSTKEVGEEGDLIRKDVRISLTEEYSDTRTGTPTVYLSLNEDGKAIQVGYSTSTTSLGYGSLSFSDAVTNEHIIENTLAEAGVVVDEAIALPASAEEYTTYASDGMTIAKEYCSFSGTFKSNGAQYEWSAVLSYDYAMTNATGNLSDTVRVIYVYVSEPQK